MSGIWENNKAKATRDTRTGRDYKSRNQAGQAVAAEAGIDPTHKPSPWVLVVKKIPVALSGRRYRQPDRRTGQTAPIIDCSVASFAINGQPAGRSAHRRTVHVRREPNICLIEYKRSNK